MTTRRAVLRAASALGLVSRLQAQPAVLQVGPSRSVKTLAEAARLARDGDSIEVDAGNYPHDVAVWTRSGLRLRSIGGRARLVADGAAAERKALWVIRASDMRVEGFDFEGTRVPDRNGAGIRLEAGSLHVKDCRFLDNENGLLTANDASIRLRLEDSEFGFNGHGDGQSHNLYAGRIASLDVIGCHFHHARVGHLLKSRAAINTILYSRLGDTLSGQASYELEFPNGGEALVMGNLIEQGPRTENPILVSFGAEGYVGPRHRLQLIHNTLVDRLPQGGTMLRVMPGDVELTAVNNLLTGRSRLEQARKGRFASNISIALGDFEDADNGNYRPRSTTNGLLMSPGEWPSPDREYMLPLGSRALTSSPTRVGALQAEDRSTTR